MLVVDISNVNNKVIKNDLTVHSRFLALAALVALAGEKQALAALAALAGFMTIIIVIFHFSPVIWPI